MHTMRTLAGACLAVLVLLPVAAAAGPPAAGAGQLQAGAEIRLFAERGPLSLFLEAAGRLDGGAGDPGTRSLQMGGYWSVTRHLHVGALWRAAAGVLHDDDWLWEAAVPTHWWWEDTSSRREHSLALDATLREELAFLPGPGWVLEWKNRLWWNTGNDQLTLTMRPGIYWHAGGAEGTLVTIALRYELYLPLNYGTGGPWEQGLYLAALWHLSGTLQAGIQYAWRNVAWGTSRDYRAWVDWRLGLGDVGINRDYRVSSVSHSLGPVLIWRFAL